MPHIRSLSARRLILGHLPQRRRAAVRAEPSGHVAESPAVTPTPGLTNEPRSEMPMNWFNFRTWVRRLRAWHSGRGSRPGARSPIRKRLASQRLATFRPDLGTLEQRETVNDAGLGTMLGGAAAAGAAGLAISGGYLFCSGSRPHCQFTGPKIPPSQAEL